MKLQINRFWSNEILEKIWNEDYTIDRSISVKDSEDEEILNINQDNYLKSMVIDNSRYVPNEGVIGGFVARQVTIEAMNLPDNVDLTNRKIVITDVIYTKIDGEDYDETEQKGVFYIDSIETKDDSGVSTIVAYDAAAKFDVPYSANITFPCTAYQLLQDVCQSCGMSSLLPASGEPELNFVNKNFIVPDNQYQTEITGDDGSTALASANCRTVIQDLAKLAFTFIYIDNNEKLQFSTMSATAPYEIDENHYYKCKSEKPNIISFNTVVLAMSGVDGENAVRRLYSGQEDVPYYIYDCNLTYTPELREIALSAIDWSNPVTWQRLFGNYIPFEMDTPWYPWLENYTDTTIVDVDGYTFSAQVFNSIETYKGYMIQTISSKPSSSSDPGNESYNTSNQAIAHQTRFIVDKASNEIRLLADKTYTKSEVKEIISGESTDAQVSYIATERGTFSNEGLRIETVDPQDDKILSDTSSLFNENGMTIRKVTDGRISTGKPIFFSGFVNKAVEQMVSTNDYLLDYEGQSVAATESIVVSKWAVLGQNSRIEDYIEDNIHKSGMFWLGDD